MSEVTYVTWSIVKAVLCPPNATPTQRSEARRACEWLTENLARVVMAINNEEAELLGMVYDQWRDHHEPPTFAIIEMAAHASGKSVVNLDEYAANEKEVERHAPDDLPMLLALRAKEARDSRIARRFRNCVTLATVGIQKEVKGEKIHIQGADAAIAHFLSGLDGDAMQLGTKPSRCSSGPGDMAFDEMWNSALADDDQDKITTGLTTIDKKVPLRKGQLVGLLGHAGQGKSTLGRTITYNAAMAGATVLIMPLELEIDEEVIALAIIHACRKFPEEAKRLGVTKAAQYQRRLSNEAKRWLAGEVKTDFRASFDGRDGRGYIQVARPPVLTLEAVISTIELENSRHGLDLVTIDYPRCLRLPGKNPRQESEDLVSRLKDLAAHFDAGRRLLVLVPIQSNRAGYEAAKKNGGAWEMSAVLEDSSYERYADLILGVYRDDDLDDEDKVRLSTPKVRNGAPIPPWDLRVDRAGRYFMEGIPPASDFDMADALDLIEDI